MNYILCVWLPAMVCAPAPPQLCQELMHDYQQQGYKATCEVFPSQQLRFNREPRNFRSNSNGSKSQK